MNILHVIPMFAKAAGTSLFCGELSSRLVRKGHNVSLAICDKCTNDVYPIDAAVKLIEVSNSLQESIALGHYDIVHIHALWTFGLHRISRWAHNSGVPTVWSTHGATAPWARNHKWWKKLPAWYVYQRRDILDASVVHATSELECAWNCKLGVTNQVVIPVGVEIPCSLATKPITEDKLNVLFVGRIHPVKGLRNLVLACSYLPFGKFRIRIVGPDHEGYKAELVALSRRLGVEHMLEWPGAKYGDDLAGEYDWCDTFVLPSFSENFGGVVLDALAHGKPVVASKFTPWRELENCDCGWWVDNSPAELAATMEKICKLSKQDLLIKGENGRNLVRQKYSWDIICDKFVSVYKGVLS